MLGGHMASTLFLRMVLRAVPVDAVVCIGENLARKGQLGSVIARLVDLPHLPDLKYVRAVVSRLLRLLPLDESLADPLYTLLARASSAEGSGGGILTYFIHSHHPLGACETDNSAYGVRVWASRVLADISTRVWPAAFQLASAMTLLLGQPPGPDASFGIVQQHLARRPSLGLPLSNGLPPSAGTLTAPGAQPAPILIELGAGTGLVSLLMAHALQRQSQLASVDDGPVTRRPPQLHLVVTDGDRAGVLRCAENVAQNSDWLVGRSPFPAVAISTAVLEWSTMQCACCSAIADAASERSVPWEAGTDHDGLLGLSGDKRPSLDLPHVIPVEPMPPLTASLWNGASILYGSDLVYGQVGQLAERRIICVALYAVLSVYALMFVSPLVFTPFLGGSALHSSAAFPTRVSCWPSFPGYHRLPIAPALLLSKLLHVQYRDCVSFGRG